MILYAASGKIMGTTGFITSGSFVSAGVISIN